MPNRLRSALALSSLLVLFSVVLPGGPAHAIPALQLYIDGATYDVGTETWTTTDHEFDLWVIGDGSDLPITDVTLTAAVESSETGSIMLTPTTTMVVSDPSTPSAPTGGSLSADGAVPLFGDGSSVPTHDIFGPGTSFYEWQLGTFDTADSPCGDFSIAFPTTLNKTCQINVYHVAVSGYDLVHFDAFGMLGNDPTKAPFSHDAALVPEPGAALLFGVGALLVSARTRRRSC